MRFRLAVIFGLIVLGVCTVASLAPPAASAQTLPPVIPGYLPVFSGYPFGFPTVWTPWNAFTGVSAPGIMFAPAAGSAQPDNCYLYDSWCSYCTEFPNADLCTSRPPGHMAAH